MSDILLVSGVPASGKSYYSDWLESTHGFMHFDVEKDGRVERQGLQEMWLDCFSGGSATPLVDALRRLGRPVVWNWGFPPKAIRIVELLKHEGVQIWWFDADHVAARSAFIKRGDVPVECLDRQMPEIVAAWAGIEVLFRPNIIKTLERNGARMTPEVIYRLMQRS